MVNEQRKAVGNTEHHEKRACVVSENEVFSH